ncbi:MAG: transporter substrate-binding domain-containing protein [Rhizobacter sp.]|nr:transporter substrate-binding domain-containing protein [Bacteriovorax sp.]
MKWILPFLLINLLFLKELHASTSVIRLCYEDSNVFPWITGDEKGLAITQLKIVEKSLPIHIKFIRLPWKRCQIQARVGQVNGIIAASYTKERTEWGTYPMDNNNKVDREYRTHTDSFFVYARKESGITWNGNNFQNLGENQVGVQLGYSVGNDLVDQGHKILSSFKTPYDLFKALDSGMVKVAVLQNHASAKSLKEHPELGLKIERQEAPFKVADQYVVFNTTFFKNNSTLCINIWKALALSRKNPDYIKDEQAFLKETATKKTGSANL